MRNFQKLLITLIATYILSASYAVADHKSGHAHMYKVTMRKVELCTGSTPNSSNMADAATCLNPVVIGSGDLEVDIAAVGAGTVAASYGEPAKFPLGETYTHMRVTIDRKMTIKGFARTSTGNDICRSQSVGSSTNYPGGSLSGNEKYSHQVALTEGTGVSIGEQVVYMVNDDYDQCTATTNCTSTSANQTMTYQQGVGSSLAQSQHASGSTSDDHIMVYQLTSPYTVGLVSPTMDIAFGTQNAIGAHDVGSLCKITNEEPIVTITLK
mgnify:CR=1 FL=1